MLLNVGPTLKFIREYYGKTQKQVAAKLQVTEFAVSHYERGKRQPTIQFLCIYAQMFQINPSYILALAETGQVKWKKDFPKKQARLQTLWTSLKCKLDKKTANQLKKAKESLGQ